MGKAANHTDIWLCEADELIFFFYCWGQSGSSDNTVI